MLRTHYLTDAQQKCRSVGVAGKKHRAHAGTPKADLQWLGERAEDNDV